MGLQEKNLKLYNAWLESKDSPTDEFINEAWDLANTCKSLHNTYTTFGSNDEYKILKYVVETIIKLRNEYPDRDKNGNAIWGYFCTIAQSAFAKKIKK
mgnify:FL=1|tara:strand:+ start:649 stop:942 length:294 start_codon:yes stop_codon:yes gene_type:complete